MEHRDGTGTTTCADQQFWTWSEHTSTLTVEVTTAGCGEAAGTWTEVGYTSVGGTAQVTFTRGGATVCQLMQVRPPSPGLHPVHLGPPTLWSAEPTGAG